MSSNHHAIWTEATPTVLADGIITLTQFRSVGCCVTRSISSTRRSSTRVLDFIPDFIVDYRSIHRGRAVDRAGDARRKLGDPARCESRHPLVIIGRSSSSSLSLVMTAVSGGSVFAVIAICTRISLVLRLISHPLSVPPEKFREKIPSLFQLAQTDRASFDSRQIYANKIHIVCGEISLDTLIEEETRLGEADELASAINLEHL